MVETITTQEWWNIVKHSGTSYENAVIRWIQAYNVMMGPWKRPLFEYR